MHGGKLIEHDVVSVNLWTDVKLNLTVYTIKNSVFESWCVVSIEQLKVILILQCDKFTGGSVAKWLLAESA